MEQPTLDRRSMLGALAAGPVLASAASTAAAATRKAAPAPSDTLIIDAVAHAYNQSKENLVRQLGTVNGSYSYHVICNPPEHRLTFDQWSHNWLPEEFIDTMLLESTTDLVCMHSVPLYGYAKDGLVTNEKGAYLKRHYPDRVLWYGGLDLGEPRERVLALVDKLVAQGADGIKLYPSGTNHETGQASDWYFDDERVAFPIFDRIREKGIRHIAVHKLLEYDMLSLTKKRYYGINDIAGAAKRYPDMTFHLVHAGWTLMENTILLLKEYPNVTAVLEGPMLWPVIDPQRFDLFMSMFVSTIGTDRLMYSSAATNPHPRFLIEAFERYQPPSGTELAFPLTAADKAAIMGGNFARIHGIDVAKRKRAIANDRFSRYRAEKGLRRPWSVIRGEA